MRSFGAGRAEAPWSRARTVPRPRHHVGQRTYRIAQRVGFRYSAPRDALVLRGIGRRWGPVLRLDERDGRPPGEPAHEAAAPAGAAVPPRIERTVDVACLPLPQLHRGQPLWQLIAVDLDARFVWADLTRTRADGAPATPAAIRFVRRVADELATRGLRLDAIVVRDGSTPRRLLFDGAAGSGIRLRHVPPGMRRERVATRTHDRLVATLWSPLFAADDERSLTALRRELRTWVDAHNRRTARPLTRA